MCENLYIFVENIEIPLYAQAIATVASIFTSGYLIFCQQFPSAGYLDTSISANSSEHPNTFIIFPVTVVVNNNL